MINVTLKHIKMWQVEKLYTQGLNFWQFPHR